MQRISRRFNEKERKKPQGGISKHMGVVTSDLVAILLRYNVR
jgi:hypothetical protein